MKSFEILGNIPKKAPISSKPLNITLVPLVEEDQTSNVG
jgi:hypothetical protein